LRASVTVESDEKTDIDCFSRSVFEPQTAKA